MRLIVTGDLHLDAVTAGVPRLPEVVDAFRQILTGDPTGVLVVLGDLCNPDRGTRTLRSIVAMRGLLEEVRAFTSTMPIILIAGNHDVVMDNTGLTSWSVFKSPPQGEPDEVETDGLMVHSVWPGEVVVCERPTLLRLGARVTDGGAHLLALPYRSPLCPYDPPAVVESARRKLTRYDLAPLVVAGHLQLEGAKLGSETADMPRGRDVAFPVQDCKRIGVNLMLNGHYHMRQQVGEVFCPGSLAALSFGEEHNTPGWMEFEL